MARVLKYDRWMSFVFAHQNPAYWHLIIDSAEKAGFEYAGRETEQRANQFQEAARIPSPFSPGN